MNQVAERVVFDCNVFFQALISPSGPAGVCLDAAKNGQLNLYLSDYVVKELRSVCLRGNIASRFGLTPTLLDEYIADIILIGTVVADFPRVFHYERDPDDEHYNVLAIATRSRLVVSRDKDLLALSDPNTEEGKSFQEQYPGIEVLTPVQMMGKLERRSWPVLSIPKMTAITARQTFHRRVARRP